MPADPVFSRSRSYHAEDYGPAPAPPSSFPSPLPPATAVESSSVGLGSPEVGGLAMADAAAEEFTTFPLDAGAAADAVPAEDVATVATAVEATPPAAAIVGAAEATIAAAVAVMMLFAVAAAAVMVVVVEVVVVEVELPASAGAIAAAASVAAVAVTAAATAATAVAVANGPAAPPPLFNCLAPGLNYRSKEGGG